MKQYTSSFDTVVMGAGSIGISVAWNIKQLKPSSSVLLIDSAEALSLTSAASGENFRNWWPHPTMKAFMDRSFDLLERFNVEHGNSVIATHNGYLLVTRNKSPDSLIENLQETFGAANELRFHDSIDGYSKALVTISDGVDIVKSRAVIRHFYPSFDKSIECLLHIRRGGQMLTQPLGQSMLADYKAAGGERLTADIRTIKQNENSVGRFELLVNSSGVEASIRCHSLVNAAGPFAEQLAAQLGVHLPVQQVLQQKIAFKDVQQVIDRRMPFTIDLDEQLIDWDADERAAVAADPTLGFLAQAMPGSIHCRPEGGEQGSFIKLGWAYNISTTEASRTPDLDQHFPEVVLRGAARLHPALKVYYDGFPREFSHYGGYYSMTAENWPLIGGTDIDGFFVACAMSGFGSMAACAAGELTAQWVLGECLPEYAENLSLRRYKNAELMSEIASLSSKGVL